MNVTIIIPSLNPDEKLCQTVQGLQAVGLTDIVLVNDGSDAEHAPIFSTLKGVTVLNHEVNRGKGRALKTAFRYVLEHRPHSCGVVTVDGDGQHRPSDVLAVAQALETDNSCVYLGTRDFSRPEVPGRSRFGNRTTSLVFLLLCGLRIHDTQTGLRGIPQTALETMLAVSGERFEYETNMLLELGRTKQAYREIAIETVYVEENKSSHFRPVRDSIRIYWFILRHLIGYAGSGFMCFLLDIGLFTLAELVLFASLPEASRIFAATALARVISSVCNFALNQYAVFCSKRSMKATLWRYYLLCGCQLLCSALSVYLLGLLLPLPSTVIKCVVDMIIFFISYRIQRGYIFT